MENFSIELNSNEKKICLNEIEKRLCKVLYIYEKSLKNEEYDYKVYVYNLALYALSFNTLYNYDLTNFIVDLNTLIVSDLSKEQIRKIVLDSRHAIKELKERIGD